MALDMDKNGVPMYTGTAEHFDAWKEGASDLFHSRAGNEGLQASTALALRGGLKDVAYEAVRKVDHKELMTVDGNGKPTIKGVEALIEYVRSSLQQEAPIRVAGRSSLCSMTSRSGATRARAWPLTSFGGTESSTS